MGVLACDRYGCENKVFGVGINDADYVVVTKKELPRVGGKRKFQDIDCCKYYRLWISMLGRCYAGTNEAYKDNYVCDDWLTFSAFREWVESQEAIMGTISGLELDKDILIMGNEIYSPSTCIFISKVINSFVTDTFRGKRKHLIGASYLERLGKFQSRCRNPFTGKVEYLGVFTNEIDAHLTWKARKHELIGMLVEAEQVTDTKVRDALLTRYV